ncbi:MAG: hypothetical protein QW666_01195 [Candidatus Woesearchaeota archaeon]
MKFGIKGEDVKKLFENLLNIEHMLQGEEKKIEINAIKILEDALKSTANKEIQEELNSLLRLLQEQKSAWEEMLILDAELKQKKYAIKPAFVPRIRQLLEKQLQLLKTHEASASKMLGKVSEFEAKIKELLKQVYGRAVSKERAAEMKKDLLLSSTDRLVPCFILTSRMSDLIEKCMQRVAHIAQPRHLLYLSTKFTGRNPRLFKEIIETKRKELINIFTAVGAVRIEKIILFKIDESQDLSILASCPPAQPQKIPGFIEQKLPGITRIKIINPVYSL